MNLVRLLLYPRWRLSAQIRNTWILIGYHYFRKRAKRKGMDLMDWNPKMQAYHVMDDETGEIAEEGFR
jgi:hypothetical protein